MLTIKRVRDGAKTAGLLVIALTYTLSWAHGLI